MAEFTFLVCSERSGSNFLTNLMNGHRDVCGPPPTHLFRLFGTNMDRYGNFDDDDNWNELLDDVVKGFNNILGSWNTSITKAELLKEVPIRSSAALLRFIYEKEANLDKASHLFVKENHCYSFVPYLISHLRFCRFLVFVRDPRDVAASWVNTPTIPGGIEEAINVWIQDQENALNLYNQLKGSGQCIAVRYEDILVNTEDCLTKILKWMQLDYQPDMLNFHKHPRTRRNANRIEAWSNLSAGVIHNNYSKFNDSLSEDEISYIEIRCAPLMDSFGYKPTQSFETATEQQTLKKIKALIPTLRTGNYQLPDDESEIRKNRLQFIKSILDRKPKCLVEM